MSDAIIQAVQQTQLKSELPEVNIGDTVDVHVRIVEGSKERVQVFTGVVIAQKGSGLEKTITVRRIVANEGVERVFPVHSPRIATIEVKRQGHTRRSKLYYLRERVGKKRRLADRRRGLGRAVAAEAKGASAESVEQMTSPEGAEAAQHGEAPVQEEAGRKE